jgi:hypothetical protein
MNWWKLGGWYVHPKRLTVEPHVCLECGVLFRPHGVQTRIFYGPGGYTHTDEMLPHPPVPYALYCDTHRKPKLALDARKKVVTDWALENWDKLEGVALAELKVTEAARLNDLVKYWESARAQSAASAQSQAGLSGLRGPYHGDFNGFNRFGGGL